MDKSGDVNVDLEALDARMQRLKGNDGGIEGAPKPRMPMRVLRNPKLATSDGNLGSFHNSTVQHIDHDDLFWSAEGQVANQYVSSDFPPLGDVSGVTKHDVQVGFQNANVNKDDGAVSSHVSSLDFNVSSKVNNECNLPDGDGIRVASHAGKFKGLVTHESDNKESPIVQTSEIKQTPSYVGVTSGSHSGSNLGNQSTPVKGWLGGCFRRRSVDDKKQPYYSKEVDHEH